MTQMNLNIVHILMFEKVVKDKKKSLLSFDSSKYSIFHG